MLCIRGVRNYCGSSARTGIKWSARALPRVCTLICRTSLLVRLSNMTAYTSFTRFRELPIEIRIMIWTESPERRDLEVIFREDIPDETDEDGLSKNEQELAFRRKDRLTPLLLRVSREAREIGLQIYLKLSFVSHEIYFNPETDTIYFSEDCEDMFAVKHLAEKKNVRYAKCDTSIWNNDAIVPPLELFCQFQNLKEITFVAIEEDPSTQDIEKAFRRASERGIIVPRLRFATGIIGTEDG